MSAYIIPAIMFTAGIAINNRKMYLCSRNKFNLSVVMSLIGLVLVFILTGFKGDIDPDYSNYMFYFDVIPSLFKLNDESLVQVKEVTSNVEMGMIYSMAILKELGLPFPFYYIFTSTLVCWLSFILARQFKGYESYILLFLYCFYFQPYYIQTRYLISVLSALIAFSCYMNNNKFNLKVFSFLCLGFSFHTVTFFSLPLFILARFLPRIRKYILVFPAVPLMLIMLDVSTLLSYAGLLNTRYDNYIINDFVEAGNISSFYVRYFLFLFLGSILFFFKSNNYGSNKNVDSMMILMLFIIVAWSLAWKFGMLYRVALLFELGWLFFIFSLERVNNVIAKSVSIILLLTYAYYRLYFGIGELERYEIYNFNIF